MTPELKSVIIFPCRGDELVGIFHEPPAETRRTGVLVVIGGPQYRVGSHRQFLLISRHLAASGFPVLRFDCRGMGDSTGSTRSFDSINEDIAAAIDAFQHQQPSMLAIIVLGLCDAASAALMYCHTDARVGGLILLNPWVRTETGAARAVVRHYYWRRLFQRSVWLKAFTGRLKPRIVVLDFIQTLLRSRHRSTQAQSHFLARMADGIAAFAKPALVILSGHDLTAKEFEDFSARSPLWSHWLSSRYVTKVQLHDADHTFSSSAALTLASVRILQWLRAVDSDVELIAPNT